ncbi:hypothetical protein CORC01_12574 [Colletotrichum orchidophilum]|uniref:Uncharacterized protein n=1 Tax=Colletotrichum orchidophilum TaxID=1209926 RepID=A0A1G4ASI5_9PEZI|nr:uncharacterized protein CORC01_12574 [Colletotrichum orchidophilum]OHE92119.1 hypothetical protein CORC01_12574 [Colletotrichum orchidophilum]
MTDNPIIQISSSPDATTMDVPPLLQSQKSTSESTTDAFPIEKKKRKRSRIAENMPESSKATKKRRIKFLSGLNSKYQKKGGPKPITPTLLAAVLQSNRPTHPFVKTSTAYIDRKATTLALKNSNTSSVKDSGEEEPLAAVEADDSDSEDNPMLSTSHKQSVFAGQTYDIPEELIENNINSDISAQSVENLEPSLGVPGKETLEDDDHCYISKAAFNLLTSRTVTLQHMTMTFIDAVNELETKTKMDAGIRDGILTEAKSLQLGIRAVSNAAFELPYAHRTGYATRTAADKAVAIIEKFKERKRIQAASKAAAAEITEMADNNGSNVEGGAEDIDVDNIGEQMTATIENAEIESD